MYDEPTNTEDGGPHGHAVPDEGLDERHEERVFAEMAPEPRRSSPVLATVMLVAGVSMIVSLLVGAVAGFGAASLVSQGYIGGAKQPTKVRVVPAETDEPVAAAAAAGLPSIVNIDVSEKAEASDPGTKNPHENALPEDHPAVSNGSGVCYKASPSGGTYILTNNHVVETADTILVTDMQGEKHKAKLIGRDANTDIAVLEVGAKLQTIKLGDSDDLLVGSLVIAIGSPFGLEHSVTSGVVSAIHRSLPDSLEGSDGNYPLVDVIQTDAAINPGNSGGALLDRQGRLVGINTAIYSNSGASDGVGFAVPIKGAERVAEEIIKGGKAKHPFLGILGQTVTETLAEKEKLPAEQGALVIEVTKGTQAEKAGLKKDDLIVALDGKPIRSMDDLLLAVRRTKVGQKVELELYRDGKRTELEMTVGTKPDSIK